MEPGRRPAGGVAIGVLAIGVLMAGLGGCAAGGDRPPPSPSGSSSPSDVPRRTALRLAVYGDAAHLQAYRRIAAAFTRQNPRISVTTSTYADASSTADAALAASGTAADVFVTEDRLLSRLVGEAALQPVDTLLEARGLQFGDGYQRTGLNAFSADARLQCMPSEVSPLVVFYNKRLIRRSVAEQLGVTLPNRRDGSWTWREFEVTARSSRGLTYSGPVSGGYVPPDTATLTAFLRSAGGDVVDQTLDPTTLALSSDEAVSTIATIAAFDRDSSVAPTPTQLRAEPPLEMFSHGHLGMYVGTRADVPRLRQAQGLSFDVLPLPSFGRPRSVAAMNGLCINRASDTVSAAADFIAFAVGPRGAQIAARSGAIVPSNLEELQRRSFTQPGRQPRNSEVFAAAARRSDPLPYSPVWSEVSLRVESLLRRAYTRPQIDLQTELGKRLARLDRRSQQLFRR